MRSLAVAACWIGLVAGVAGCDLVFPIHGAGDDDGAACPPPPALDCGLDAPDEDLDQIPDDCDLCPQSPGVATDMMTGGADADHDGVGDRCDPDPGVATSCPRWFTGLGDVTRFSPTAGWVLDGDGYIVMNEPPPLLTQDLFGGGRLQTLLDDDFTDPGAHNGVWMMASAGASPDGYFCGFIYDVTGDTAHLALEVSDAGANPPMTTTTGAVPVDMLPGNSHVLELTVSHGVLDCRSADKNSLTEDDVQLVNTRFHRGRLGLGSIDSDSSFEYLDFVPE